MSVQLTPKSAVEPVEQENAAFAAVASGWPGSLFYPGGWVSQPPFLPRANDSGLQPRGVDSKNCRWLRCPRQRRGESPSRGGRHEPDGPRCLPRRAFDSPGGGPDRERGSQRGICRERIGLSRSEGSRPLRSRERKSNSKSFDFNAKVFDLRSRERKGAQISSPAGRLLRIECTDYSVAS